MILQHAHSVLSPANAQASDIVRLFDYFVIVSAIVTIAVVAAALWAGFRRRALDEDVESPEREAGARRVVIGAVAVTIAILFVTLTYDLSLGRSIMHSPKQDALIIDVTGHQWWWQVEYEHPVAQNRVVDANELHLPAGRPVMIRLASHDVIHSLWLPNLGVKKDLIPGHDNVIMVTARDRGVFRSQCAEFCGLQHAKMSLYVVVQSPEEFERWRAQAHRPAAPPPDSLTLHGRNVFETGPCAMCHNITGTTASGTVGPDLTHVASRLSLAAGTLPNTKGHLAGWIVDAQRIKPGVIMPSNGLEPGDLQALLAYLGTLK